LMLTNGIQHIYCQVDANNTIRMIKELPGFPGLAD
jgi:hypothetical protein